MPMRASGVRVGGRGDEGAGQRRVVSGVGSTGAVVVRKRRSSARAQSQTMYGWIWGRGALVRVKTCVVVHTWNIRGAICRSQCSSV